MFCGMTGNFEFPAAGDAKRIWSRTTWRMVLSLNPCWRSDANASSRFGPTLPVVPASASVWQTPHLATKSCFPLEAFVLRSTPPVPQPPATPAAKRAASAGVSARARLRRRLGRVKLLERFGAGRVDGKDPVETGDFEDLGDVLV